MKITLKEILESLSHGSLSFMSESNHSNGTISEDQIPKVINRINSVIRKLSVKFVLNEKSVRIRVSTDRRYYPLTAGSAWIIAEPGQTFDNDVETILGVETPQGRMHDLGDKATHTSILLRDDAKAIAMDTALEAGVYTIFYKAKTPKFTLRPVNLEEIINIPEALLEALYTGVAALTYEGIGGPENIRIGQSKWNQFEKECLEAKINTAVEITETDEGNKFRDRGFL